MFERFTERARQVVVLAQDEARTLRHNYIGTEHLLLGLLREGGVARAFEQLEVTLEEVQAQVARIIGQGDEVATGQIPFTPRAKKVLELSLREALNEGDNYIGPEHILLGLVAEGEGVAARILMDFAPLGNIRLAALDVGEEEEFKPESPPLAPEVIEEIERVRGEKEKALESQDWERAAEARDREFRLSNAARSLQRAWRGEEPPRAQGLPWSVESTVGGSAESTYRLPPFFSRIPKRSSTYGPPTLPSQLLVGWMLFAVALGVGVLIGWAIWG
jgi:Clp amino terminal domain, pathogenicity island component